MNISSVVVNVKENFTQQVKKMIDGLKGCEIVASNDDKIVVLITALNLDDELKKFKSIEHLEYVNSVSMVYSYQEDIKEDLSQSLIDSFLNDDIDAKNIKYSGDLYKNI